MHLDYRVLGPISVELVDGRAAPSPVDIGGPRQRRLLAALVLGRGRPIDPDRLAEIVWAGDPPEGARNTLRTYIARLRRALEVEGNGAAPISTESLGWRLDLPDEHLDSARFESLLAAARAMSADAPAALATLDEALALWRDDAYVEFADEDWCRAEAARCDELHLVAQEERFDAMLGCGLHVEVVADLDAFIAVHPLRDRPRGLRMLALYRSGRQVEALRVFQDYRRYLEEEVGVEPSAELRALESQIVARDPSLQIQVPAGRALRGYLIGARIGEGAFGAIYRASQPSVGREVAIKVVRAELADDPEFIRRFEAEAQTIAALEHPHIVPLYDYWREPGGAYLVMRYLSGGSAEARLAAHGPISLDEAVRLVEEIGGALAAAHEAGVAHRDVRAANILFDAAGNAYLSDFGVAGMSGESADTGDDVRALAETVIRLLGGDAGSLDSVRSDLPIEVAAALSALAAGENSATIDELLVAMRPRSRPRRVRATNPYKGLLAFQESDAADFFGRDEIVGEMHAHLASSRFLVVVGPSGSGKSSAVRAGLVPRLRRDGEFVVAVVPGAHPLDELETALLRISTEPLPTLLDQIQADDRGLVRAVHRVLPGGTGGLVIVVDQFEELFTLAPPERRRAFLDRLAAAVTDDRSRVRVVCTLRADFYDRPLQEEAIADLVRVNTIALTPLSAAEVERAIVGPAERVGVEVEPALVARVVDDVAREPGGLPLLQYALTETFARRNGGAMTAERYEAIGGIRGALARRAEELYQAAEIAEQEATKQLFLRLVAPREGGADTSRRVLRRELDRIPEAVIARYGESRLLLFDRSPESREPTVEIAHEALIREWPRLRSWLEEDRACRLVVRDVQGAAAAWEQAARDDDDLLRGARLAAAEERLLTHAGELTDVEVEFVERGIAARDAARDAERATAVRQRKQNRRLRGLLVAAAVLVVVALVAGVVAFQQRDRADERASETQFQRMLSEVRALAETDRELAMLVAAEAHDREPGRASQGALLEALMIEPRFLASRATGLPLTGPATVGPDGEWLFWPSYVGSVAAGDDTTGRWFDTETFEELGVVEVDGRRNLTSSPAGDVVVDWQQGDTEVTVLDPSGGFRGALVASAGDAAVSWARFASDDVLLVARYGEPVTIEEWDTTELSLRSRIDLPREIAEVVELATDSAGVVVALAVPFGPPGAGDELFAIDLEAGTASSIGVVDLELGLIEPLAVSGDGDAVALGTSEGIVQVRSIGDGEVRATFDAGERVHAIDWLDDYSIVATTTSGAITYWDLETGRAAADPIDAQIDELNAVVERPDGTVVTVARSGEIQRYSNSELGAFGRMLAVDEPGLAEFTPSGSRFLLPNTPSVGFVTVFDSESVEAVGEFAHPTSSFLLDSDFTSDGATVAVATIDGEIALFDTVAWEPTGAEFSVGGPGPIAFDPSGTRLATGHHPDEDEFGATIFDAATGAETALVLPAYFDGVADLDWSPDGALLLGVDGTGGDAIFDPDSGEQVGARLSAQAARQMLHAAWDIDGEHVLGIGVEGVRRWNVESGVRMPVLERESGGVAIQPVHGVGLLATQDSENRPHLWDRSTGRLVGVPFPTLGLSGVTDFIGPLAHLSADGRFLTLSGAEGTVIWDLDPEGLRDAACRLAGRNMTLEEWERIFGDGEHQATCSLWPVE